MIDGQLTAPVHQVIEEPLLSAARQLVAKQGTEEASSAASDKEDDEEAQFPPYQIRITCSSPPPGPAQTLRQWQQVRLCGVFQPLGPLRPAQQWLEVCTCQELGIME